MEIRQKTHLRSFSHNFLGPANFFGGPSEKLYPSPGPGAGQNLDSSASAVTQTNVSRKLLFPHRFLGSPSFRVVPRNSQGSINWQNCHLWKDLTPFWVTKGPHDEIDLAFVETTAH